MIEIALGKVAKIDRTVASDDECLTLPYVGLENIEKESGRFSDDFVPTPLNMLATNFRFTPKHVLYGKLRPYLNKVVLPNFDGVCTTEILPILPDEKRLDRTFLWAILYSPKFVAWATSQISGANLPRLDPKLLAEYPLPLPPLPEQRRIAARLRRADHLRRMQRYADGLSGSMLQSVFLEMFGDPATNPRGWKSEILEDICNEITVGYVGPMASEYIQDGILFLRSLNIKPFVIDLNDAKFISSEFHKQLKKSALFPGDVVVVRTGIAGTAAVVPDNFPSANCADLVVIRPSPKINNHYLTMLFNSTWGKEHVKGNAVGQIQQHFNIGSANEMIVPLPPLDQQERFAGVVRQVEALRRRQSEARRQAEGLFQGLLQKSFFGEKKNHVI